MKKILITGGCGFLGSHLTEFLLANKFAVRIFDTHSFPYVLNDEQRDNFEEVIGDLTNFSDVQKAVEGCEGILHLAAISRVKDGYLRPYECISTNILGTANILESIRLSLYKPWIIISSTLEVFSDPVKALNIETMYGITKFSLELCSHIYSKDYGLKVLIVRLSSIYGSERDNPNKVLPIFLNKALKGETLFVNDLKPIHDYIHYKDIVSGMQKAIHYIDKSINGTYEVMAFCSGTTLSLKDIAQIVIEETNSKSEMIVRDKSSEIEKLTVLENDPSKSKELIGFESKIVLGKGIKELLLDKKL